uniref:uncharacterized protein LOC109958418 isoform X1 n=1 Tax=Monopterus albus TaxID=43700 RepID=UPI0009B36728|nr:uncharacterized protein LOC109958418 isoform X1 [Monopterus albus]
MIVKTPARGKKHKTVSASHLYRYLIDDLHIPTSLRLLGTALYASTAPQLHHHHRHCHRQHLALKSSHVPQIINRYQALSMLQYLLWTLPSRRHILHQRLKVQKPHQCKTDSCLSSHKKAVILTMKRRTVHPRKLTLHHRLQQSQVKKPLQMDSNEGTTGPGAL